ncbi:adhesion G protein-coupled receptor E2-like [Xenia sp. Carnegie-2017]|uniref:adhesion G protein-coupled receptor E2-like n=1 Tax=Xenia sp. Carnegie-2017 TaxID=2897299 RepID=UPI001F047F8A|nr:adhesion G protein-coupled receptor E2-like [Xenia sp. Carnegie-2017]
MINGSSGVAKIFQLNASHVHDVEYEPVDLLYDGRKYRAFSFQLELTIEQSLIFAKYITPERSNIVNSSYFGSNFNIHSIAKLLFFTQDFNVTVTVSKNSHFLKEGTTFSLTVFKTTSRRLACIRKQFYPKDAYKTAENGEVYIINATGKTYPKKEVFVEPDNHTISVCEEIVYSNCDGRRVNLSSDDFVMFTNLSILCTCTQTIYNFGEYDVRDGEIFMCISDSFTRTIHWSADSSTPIEEYLTFCCLIISMVCLFLVIFTHLLFPELHNLAGRDVTNLSISLFLVQLFWLLPVIDSHVFCRVMAALKHYLFLVSFVTLAMIAWDTERTFANKRVPKKRLKNEENKKFVKYVAITWSLPALFVIICVVLDRTDSFAIYYNDLKCWFDNELAQKYLFVLPVGILLLFNVVVFSLTVYYIQRSSSGASIIHHGEGHHRKMLWIYIKISSLMGFSWLFGFLYLAVGSLAISYLFDIFASLQGVYIAVAFVMKKTILQKYKQLFRPKNAYQADYRTIYWQDFMSCRETRL